MGGTGSKGSEETALLPASRNKYKQNDLAGKHAWMAALGKQDFYDLFGLDRFAEMTDDTVSSLHTAFRRLCRDHHPDRRPPEEKEQAEAMIVKLALAKETLLTPDHKRRYDDELRGTNAANGWKWYARWGYSIVTGLGGLACVLAGVLAVPVTGGASIALSLAGSSLMASGIKTGMKHYNDPNCSDTEFLKDCAVGALAGAAGGGIGVAAAGAMAGASAVACIGHSAWSGAAAVAAAAAIEDGTDLALDNIPALKGVKESCADLKTTEEICSAAHIARRAKMVIGGAVVGVAVQGVANACVGGQQVSQKAAELTDDVANQVVTNANKAVQGASDGVRQLKNQVQNFNYGAEFGKALLKSTTENVTQAAIDHAGETLIKTCLEGKSVGEAFREAGAAAWSSAAVGVVSAAAVGAHVSAASTLQQTKFQLADAELKLSDAQKHLDFVKSVDSDVLDIHATHVDAPDLSGDSANKDMFVYAEARKAEKKSGGDTSTPPTDMSAFDKGRRPVFADSKLGDQNVALHSRKWKKDDHNTPGHYDPRVHKAVDTDDMARYDEHFPVLSRYAKEDPGPSSGQERVVVKDLAGTRKMPIDNHPPIGTKVTSSASLKKKAIASASAAKLTTASKSPSTTKTAAKKTAAMKKTTTSSSAAAMSTSSTSKPSRPRISGKAGSQLGKGPYHLGRTADGDPAKEMATASPSTRIWDTKNAGLESSKDPRLVTSDLRAKHDQACMNAGIVPNTTCPVQTGVTKSGNPIYCGKVLDANNRATMHVVCKEKGEFIVRTVAACKGRNCNGAADGVGCRAPGGAPVKPGTAMPSLQCVQDTVPNVGP